MNLKIFESKIFLGLVFFFLAIGITLNLFGFKLYTIAWHVFNPNPVKWEIFEVYVPDDLIAKTDESGKIVTKLRIFLIKNALGFSLAFTKFKKPFVDSISLRNVYKTINYKILKELPCEILNHRCKWFQVLIPVGDKKIFGEEIVFIDEKFSISYMGNLENRHYFLDIIKNLRRIEPMQSNE